MSLAGFRDLATLKARLMPADMGEGWEYDNDIRAIGLGVAAAFDAATGRTLRRTVGAVHECSAGHDAVVVGCYPIETITAATVDNGTEWSVLDLIAGKQPKAGIVLFHGCPGAAHETLRITVTGGYWCLDTEGGDTTCPVGATPIPDDLVQAWYLQCRAVCDTENVFRSKGAGAADRKGGPLMQDLDFLPAVRRTLQLHTRLG
jgi:hypothetical protein